MPSPFGATARTTFQLTTHALTLNRYPAGFRSTPRWIALGDVRNKAFPGRNTSCVVLVADLKNERDIGMGRAWQLRDLGEQETYMASSALFELGIKANAGERVILKLDILELLDTVTTDDSQL